MPQVSLTPSLVRSRFGRRLVLLFVVCSLLPSVALALLSFGTVNRQLRQASLDRLEHSGRQLGHDIVERLQFLHQDLDRLPLRPRPCLPKNQRDSDLVCDGYLEYGLSALAFVPDRGPIVQFFGTINTMPVLAPAEQQQIAGGRDVVLDRITRRGPAVYLVRPLRGAGILVGRVDPSYLWGGTEQSSLVSTMQFHVVNAAAQVLSRRQAMGQELPAGIRSRFDGNTSGTFEWDIDDIPHLAAYAPLPDTPDLAVPLWTLIVSEARSSVVAPMDDFKRTFPIVIALALGAAIALGLSQLRRSLEPLDALHAATHRLADRQFDQPVTVASRDEFAEVAASFNAMTDRIRRQFTALTTAAEIDRAVLSSVDTDRIVLTVLDRMGDVCSCDVVAVVLFTGTDEITMYLRGHGDTGRMETSVTRIDPGERDQLATAPRTLDPSDGVPAGYLAPVIERGGRHLLLLPLRYQTELLGGIVLGGHDAVTLDEEARVHVNRLTGQVALALTNARMVDQIRRLAFYDSLTGLPNRVSFKQRLSDELERAGREGAPLAVCFLDLDHFSRINDTLGHKFGDRLVQEVGRRVKARCRESALGAELARLGGDEFTVILPQVDSAAAAEVAHCILESFETPFALDGHEVFVSTSIGVALYPADGLDMESLLKNADVAMYQAKQKGRNRVELYADAMSEKAARRLTLENHLRKALEAGQFVLCYQPIINLSTGRIASAEALIRWEHPDLGMVPPAEFIPVCEESGLIVPLGEWILRTVCEQNMQWQRAGLRHLPVAINISGQQLRSDATVELVRQVLGQTELDPRHLTLELTESILMQGDGEAAAALQQLASLGIGLAIDDFGTGYSSLSYLKHFPVNTVKIDQSFIRDVTTNADDAAITTAIIAMGNALDLRVVAEGVETEDQVEFLLREGCDAIQGYLVGYPVAADDFARLLRKDGVLIGRRPGRRGKHRRLRRAG